MNQSQNESIYEPSAASSNKKPWLSLEGIQAILIGTVSEICQNRLKENKSQWLIISKRDMEF